MDLVLLAVYVGISFYNARNNILELKADAKEETDFTLAIFLLAGLNITILLRRFLKIHIKLEEYRDKELKRCYSEKRPAVHIYVLAWQEKLHIIIYAFIAIVMVLLVIAMAGNKIAHPIGLVAIIVVSVTLVIDVIENIESILGLKPHIYVCERR